MFEKYQLDYCCGGRRGVEQACHEKGLAVEQVLAEVEQALPADSGKAWAGAPLFELIDHIVGHHHAFLRSELPVLEKRLAKVIEAHSVKHGDSLFPLEKSLRGLAAELSAHMMKEEMILFPLIKRMELADQTGAPLPGAHCGSVNNPIQVMMFEHDGAAMALREMRRITADYTVPAEACNTYRVLFEGLRALEADLHVHIHLENNILFPKAAELESRLTAA